MHNWVLKQYQHPIYTNNLGIKVVFQLYSKFIKTQVKIVTKIPIFLFGNSNLLILSVLIEIMTKSLIIDNFVINIHTHSE